MNGVDHIQFERLVRGDVCAALDAAAGTHYIWHQSWISFSARPRRHIPALKGPNGHGWQEEDLACQHDRAADSCIESEGQR
jgi:hypothetical protein